MVNGVHSLNVWCDVCKWGMFYIVCVYGVIVCKWGMVYGKLGIAYGENGSL